MTIVGRAPAPVLAVIALLVLVLAGCSSSSPESAGGNADAKAESAESAAAQSEEPDEPSPQSEGESAQEAGGEGVDQAVDSLTLEEQVGQLFMVGVDVKTQQQAAWDSVRQRHVGNVFLAGRTQAGVGPVANLARSFTDLAGEDFTGGIGLLVATDQEGGAVQVLRGPGYSDIPSALTQSTWTAGDLEARAGEWGAQLASSGVNLNLAPVMDLVDGDPAANPPIGAWSRQYGGAPGAVAEHAAAFARGMKTAGVAVSIKHFPGLGRVDANTDTDSGVTDAVTTRSDPSIGTFARGIDAGADTVMMSTAIYSKIDPSAPAAFSHTVVSDVLRGELGFDGVVLTDDVSAAVQVQAWAPGDRAVQAIAAGCDIVLMSADPATVAPAVDAVLDKARGDVAFEARVRESAARVLALKKSLGIAVPEG